MMIRRLGWFVLLPLSFLAGLLAFFDHCSRAEYAMGRTCPRCGEPLEFGIMGWECPECD